MKKVLQNNQEEIWDTDDSQTLKSTFFSGGAWAPCGGVHGLPQAICSGVIPSSSWGIISAA